MKYHGCQSYYKLEREADLLRAYRSCIASCNKIVLPDIYQQVVKMPAKRFWVSEERTAIVISQMYRGDKLLKMNKNKRDMFNEIFRRVKKLRREKPDLPLNKIVHEVVHQQAPEFYITPGSARIIIFYAKKRWVEEKERKLRHLFM